MEGDRTQGWERAIQRKTFKNLKSTAGLGKGATHLGKDDEFYQLSPIFGRARQKQQRSLACDTHLACSL